MKKEITRDRTVKVVYIPVTTQQHIFCNVENKPMAAGWMHPERTSFHGHVVDEDHVVVSVEHIFDNGVGLYPAPMKEDYTLCLG